MRFAWCILLVCLYMMCGVELMKIRVWIQSPDNASFNEDDIIEVPDNISDDELEETAWETAFDHIDWDMKG